MGTESRGVAGGIHHDVTRSLRLCYLTVCAIAGACTACKNPTVGKEFCFCGGIAANGANAWLATRCAALPRVTKRRAALCLTNAAVRFCHTRCAYPNVVDICALFITTGACFIGHTSCTLPAVAKGNALCDATVSARRGRGACGANHVMALGVWLNFKTSCAV